jgi:hypothetical protein
MSAPISLNLSSKVMSVEMHEIPHGEEERAKGINSIKAEKLMYDGR